MSQALLEQKVSSGEEDLHQYLQEIRRYPRLTPEQERELAMECARGNEEAIRQMVNANLRLVVSVARQYAGRGVPLPDLIQEGSIGLMTAAKKFDYTLDYRFSTYATKWIRQGISRYITNQAGLIRVPAYTAQKAQQVIAGRTELQQGLDRMPTEEELARHMDMPEQKIRELLQLFPEVCSLDAPNGERTDSTLQSVLENASAPQPQEMLARQEMKTMLDRLLGMLNQRQRLALRLRYGMEDGTCHSFEEVGSRLGVSKERARQIERQAVSKLQKLGAELGLEDFLNE